MSKAKKIISMLLAIAMVLTVAPVSVLASAASPSYTYGNLSFSNTEFTVDTSATTEVIRVAAGLGSFSLGTTVTPATPSGIPESSGTYASVGYGGETPEIPTVRFTISGVRPDETPSVTAEGASLTINDATETISGTTYTYEWKITAGTASAGNDVVFEITYKINGTSYKAYAFSHVEDILVMNGFLTYKQKKNGDTGSVNSRHSLIVQVQSKNMYSAMCQDTSVSNRVVGYINYATTEALSGDALLGCGSESDLDSSINAYGSAAPNDVIAGEEVPALIKSSISGTSGSRYNMCYNNDTNKGQPKIYIDQRNEDIEKINFRMTIQAAESKNFSDARVNNVYLYTGKQTLGEGDAPSASTLSTSIMNVKSHNAAPGGSASITSRGAWAMTTFNGTGPTSIGGPTYYSTFVDLISNESGNTNNAAGGINFEFYTYDTTDLYNLIQGINAGTGTYTCKSTLGFAGAVLTFDKGKNPQVSMYTANSWNTFIDAYKTACSTLVRPDTNQSEIETDALALWNAYAALEGYNENVNYVVQHCISGTSTQIIPSQTGTKTAGTTMTAYCATIEGYNVSGSQVSTTTFSGKNATETVTFYYTPKSYNVIAYTNNDNDDQGVYQVSYGTTFDVSTAAYGTKENYTFDGWYYDNNVWSQPVPDSFEMGSSNVVIYAKWVTTPIEVYAIPVVDGQQLEEQKLGQISPDELIAVTYPRPADLVLDGYLFVEYYEDAELTTPVTWPLRFNFGDPLKKTIYARMVDVNGKIVFESNGGTAVADLAFTVGVAVDAPAAPTKEGYAFDQWYYDRDLTQPITWPVTQSTTTGFIAYAGWTAQDVSISFQLGTPTSNFDTEEIPSIIGKADAEISEEDYPPVPKKYGYVFDHWVDADTGVEFKFEEGACFSTKDITLKPIWRGTDYSAFVDITAYEKLSGQYVETETARTGDIITFRMTSQTNFYTGSSAFVFMYDKTFFDLVNVDAAAFTLNGENEYVSGINAKIQGVTDISTENWPDSMKSLSGQYAAMLLTIDPTVTVADYNTEPMSDGLWLVEFQLKVKDDATGSGTVYMDNAWTRNADNPMGTMFYGWSEKSVSVLETYNNVVTPDLDEATATITIDETEPVITTLELDANNGAWADGDTTKTYEGRAETEILGYTSPTRDGYELTGWVKDGDETVTWAEGYYATEEQNGSKFIAQWSPLSYTINYYKDAEGTTLHWTTEGEFEQAYAAPPANPTKTGYTFGGWVDADGNAAPATTPLGGIDLYPDWQPADVGYTIVISYVNNASGSTVTNKQAKSGLTGQKILVVEELPETLDDNTIYLTPDDFATVANYYVYDKSNNTLPIEATVAADGSTVININYVAVDITFTYDANGGAFSDGSTQMTETRGYLSAAQGPDDEPTREGYDFVGWNTSKTATTSNLTAGSTRMQKATTYYAVWTAKKYPVIFDANGGCFDNDTSVTTKTTEVTYGSAITASATPAKEGYDFIGWATTADASASEALGTMDTTDEAGKTFYAVYKLTDYTVEYFVDGDSYKSETANMGDTITVIDEPSKVGYVFSGWTKDGAEITAGSTFTMPAGNVTIEGEYTPISYDVTFDANGGYFDSDETVLTKVVSVPYETAISVPASPDRQGYQFLGWTDTEGSTTTVTIGNLTTAGEVTYYAVWKALYANYTINTYYMDVNGAYLDTADSTETKQGTVAESVTYTPADVTGFELDTDNSVLEGVVAADGSLVLTVKYIRKQYTLYTTVQDTTTEAGKYYYGAAVTEPADPGIEGYTFNGWTPSVPETMPAEDVTVKADLSLAKFHVAFYTDETMTSVVSEGEYDYMMDIVAPTATKEGYSFDAWIDAETGATVDFDNTTVKTPAKAVKYYATWTINQYTITFGNTGDSTIDPITQDYGTAVTAPENPTRKGYTFNGWSPSIPETMPAKDTKINATWTINKYTVTFDAAGGTVISPEDGTEGATYSVTANYGNDEWVAPEDPTREGYTFNGWDKEVPTSIPAEDTTITAQWTINQYTITFANTGDTTIAPITQDYGTAVTAPENPTREGYEWNGWDKDIPETMPAENITITGQWTINQYTITFANTGDTVIAPITQDYGTAVTAPADPTREGYEWKGWDVSVPNTMPAENITITGQWEIKQYTVTFDTDGGSAVDPITQDYASTVTLPAAPTKEGYDFAGWKRADGTVLNAGDTFTMPVDGETVTATWDVIQYTITFDTDGGSAVDPITQDYASTVTLPAAPTKEGSTFTGWKRADGTVLQAGDTFAMPVNGETVTATWDVNNYTLTWVIDGVKEEETYAYGAAVNKHADPEKTGYSFTGWDKDIPDTMPAENITITANFRINQYTITFENTGDTVIAPITQDYGTAVTAPEAPVKDGYEWKGWDKGIPDTMPAEDITITGQWSINQYEVKFLDAEGGEFTKLTLDYGTAIEAPATSPEKQYYTFAGWSLDGTTVADDLGTVPSNNIEITPIYTKDTVTLVTNSTATVDTDYNPTAHDPEYLVGYIYGLETRLTTAKLLDTYLAVSGDGRLEVTLTKYNVCGTGTRVDVYDRNDTPDDTSDDILVETYILVIFGDINGDSDIDATDYSMASTESLGGTGWSIYDETADITDVNANVEYDYAKVLAADLNKDGKITGQDLSVIEDVSLYVSELNQQTGEVTPY